jgi:hypothetical protein
MEYVTYLHADKSVTDYPREFISPYSDENAHGLHVLGGCK